MSRWSGIRETSEESVQRLSDHTSSDSGLPTTIHIRKARLFPSTSDFEGGTFQIKTI